VVRACRTKADLYDRQNLSYTDSRLQSRNSRPLEPRVVVLPLALHMLPSLRTHEITNLRSYGTYGTYEPTNEHAEPTNPLDLCDLYDLRHLPSPISETLVFYHLAYKPSRLYHLGTLVPDLRYPSPTTSSLVHDFAYNRQLRTLVYHRVSDPRGLSSLTSSLTTTHDLPLVFDPSSSSLAGSTRRRD
jgi:hypothetical protein